jgi:hypothetical protein
MHEAIQEQLVLGVSRPRPEPLKPMGKGPEGINAALMSRKQLRQAAAQVFDRRFAIMQVYGRQQQCSECGQFDPRDFFIPFFDQHSHIGEELVLRNPSRRMLANPAQVRGKCLTSMFPIDFVQFRGSLDQPIKKPSGV